MTMKSSSFLLCVDQCGGREPVMIEVLRQAPSDFILLLVWPLKCSYSCFITRTRKGWLFFWSLASFPVPHTFLLCPQHLCFEAIKRDVWPLQPCFFLPGLPQGNPTP